MTLVLYFQSGWGLAAKHIFKSCTCVNKERSSLKAAGLTLGQLSEQSAHLGMFYLVISIDLKVMKAVHHVIDSLRSSCVAGDRKSLQGVMSGSNGANNSWTVLAPEVSPHCKERRNRSSRCVWTQWPKKKKTPCPKWFLLGHLNVK